MTSILPFCYVLIPHKSESLYLLCGNHIPVLLKGSEVDIINAVYKVRLKEARSLTKVSELLRCTAWGSTKSFAFKVQTSILSAPSQLMVLMLSH